MNVISLVYLMMLDVFDAFRVRFLVLGNVILVGFFVSTVGMTVVVRNVRMAMFLIRLVRIVCLGQAERGRVGLILLGVGRVLEAVSVVVLIAGSAQMDHSVPQPQPLTPPLLQLHPQPAKNPKSSLTAAAFATTGVSNSTINA